MTRESKVVAESYSKKGAEYFGSSRPEMMPFIPENVSKLLDVGCGAGQFGAAVKEARAGCSVWGVELNKEAAKIAQEQLDHVIVGQFSKEANGLEEEDFDCIVFNDVLEHMIEPGDALSFARTLLRSDGLIVASIPNILHFYQIGEILLNQDWRYRDEGILDSTHLRFFTKKSIQRMFEMAGFETIQISGINPFTGFRFAFANALLFGRISDWRYVQFAVQAWKF